MDRAHQSCPCCRKIHTDEDCLVFWTDPVFWKEKLMSGYKSPSYEGHYQSNVNHKYEQNFDYDDYESDVVPFSRYQEDYNGRYYDYFESTYNDFNMRNQWCDHGNYQGSSDPQYASQNDCQGKHQNSKLDEIMDIMMEVAQESRSRTEAMVQRSNRIDEQIATLKAVKDNTTFIPAFVEETQEILVLVDEDEEEVESLPELEVICLNLHEDLAPTEELETHVVQVYPEPLHTLIVSHPNRWRNHRGMALSETDCSEVSITIIITIQFKLTRPLPCPK
ncbi:hypothetical protein HanOQP8_Chr11g0391681 [Helianthus annuus]|nr:hypothetical protein HanHA89_Chr11g0411411 [Helianthus annuus]KAJ0688196.1 hypothetical protein HanOQP8_Chr11g0391681 [Helianthus annuus]